MNYHDTLTQMNLDDDASITISYSTNRDVWFTEDYYDYDLLVNRTDLFRVWWSLLDLPSQESELEYYLDRAREFTDLTAELGDDDYDLAADKTAAYQAFQENPGDLFDFIDVETIRHDNKRGEVQGSWQMDVSWDEIRDNEAFWNTISGAKGKAEFSVETPNGVLTLAS